MFVVCTPEQSDALHQELIQIEQELFTELGLHFKVGGEGGPSRAEGTDTHTQRVVCVLRERVCWGLRGTPTVPAWHQQQQQQSVLTQ